MLVGALVFFDLVLWFAVAPLLPGWEESLGLSKAQSGIVVGAYSAAVLLASVPAGNLADRFGPRRVTIAATLLFGIAAPLHAFVGSFAELVGLRFAAGVFSAVSWSAALAWAIGSVPPARRGRTAALINTGLPIGAIAGPLFGGPFVQLVGLKAAMGALGVVVLMLGARRVARARGRRAQARARAAAREHPHGRARLLAAQRQRRADRARDRGHDDADARLAAPRRPGRVAERRRRGLHARRDRAAR